MGRTAAHARILNAVLIPLLVTSACYTYQPIETVSIGDRVEARLTTEEAIRQSEIRGDPLREIQGTVLGVTEETISIEVVTARGQSLTENFEFVQNYTVPRAGILELNRRTLSPVRSLGTALVVGGLVYLILDTTIIGAGGNGPGDNGDPVDIITRIRIGR